MKKLQVVKANRLVQASYTLSLVEQRIILLSVIKHRESGQTAKNDSFLKIHSSEYAKNFGVSKQSAQEAISNAVKTLFERRVTISTYKEDYKKNVQTTIRWINAMTYIEEASTIEIRFNPEIVEEFTRLESNFTSYMLENVKDLNSAYSIRLYEVLSQYRSMGKTPLIEVAEFRRLMGLDDTEYKYIDDLKRRVLDLAVKQVKTTTDLDVCYEQFKQGRSIKGFVFFINPKVVEKAKSLSAKNMKKSKPIIEPPKADISGLELVMFNDLRKHYPALSREYLFNLAKNQNLSVFDLLIRMESEREEGIFELIPSA